MFYFDPIVSLSIPITETHVTDPTADKIVFITDRCGILNVLFYVTVEAAPALKKSQEQKTMKFPPTTNVKECGLKPSPIC